MDARFGTFGRLQPAAAFDVLDLDPAKIGRAEAFIKRLNDDLTAAAKSDAGAQAAIRQDVRSVDGMVRFPEATKDMPWHADRPAIAVYDTLGSDGRLSANVRSDARAASAAVRDLVLAHRESDAFAPFDDADDADYSDAAGPTVHLPASRGQIDPWAKNGVSETHNAFYDAVDGPALTRAIA